LFSSHEWGAIDHPHENTVEHARRDRGLKVDDGTSEMMKEVERELTVTKACSHQHVVSILGLMEYCDTLLAKYIKAHVATLHLNWPELIRYLMDGAAGWCGCENEGERE